MVLGESVVEKRVRVLNAADIALQRTQQSQNTSFESESSELVNEVTMLSLNSSEVFEQWLFDERASLVFSESERVQEHVKFQEGLVVLVNFVTFPQLYTASTTWASEIHKTSENELRSAVLHKNQPVLDPKATGIKRKNTFFTRSYKATLALADKRNSEHLERVFPSFLDVICIIYIEFPFILVSDDQLE